MIPNRTRLKMDAAADRLALLAKRGNRVKWIVPTPELAAYARARVIASCIRLDADDADALVDIEVLGDVVNRTSATLIAYDELTVLRTT